MNLSDIRLSDIPALKRAFPLLQRETLEKYLPVVLAILAAWLFARFVRKSFWTMFAMFWALKAAFGVHFGPF